MHTPRFTMGLSLPLLALAAAATITEAAPDAARQRVLAALLYQDCGSCHGIRLTGGLGPPLVQSALADKPRAVLEEAILHGRPGTPMPGWQGLLSVEDVRWLVDHLLSPTPPPSERQTRSSGR